MKIVMSVLAIFFLLGCSGDDKKKSSSDASVVKEHEKQKVTQSVPGKHQEIKETKISKEVEAETKKVEQKVVQKVEAKVEEVEQKEVSFKSGKEIFSACSGCHGVDGSKSALGKSKAIKGWGTQKVLDALNGYKVGTYGGSMKGLMKGQVTKLSDTEIEAVAKYISTL